MFDDVSQRAVRFTVRQVNLRHHPTAFGEARRRDERNGFDAGEENVAKKRVQTIGGDGEKVAVSQERDEGMVSTSARQRQGRSYWIFRSGKRENSKIFSYGRDNNYVIGVVTRNIMQKVFFVIIGNSTSSAHLIIWKRISEVAVSILGSCGDGRSKISWANGRASGG